MNGNQTAHRCILACVLVYLICQIAYLSRAVMPLARAGVEREIVALFLIQSVFLAACIFVYFIFLIWIWMKRENTSPFTSILIVDGDGKIKREVTLQDKASFLVTGAKKGKQVFVESMHEPASDRHVYGVCNLANGSWYFEILSKTRPVGLKRGSENRIYRLKEGMLYQLKETDVIYADTCKLVFKTGGDKFTDQRDLNCKATKEELEGENGPDSL